MPERRILSKKTIQAFKEGSMEAFNQVYDRYYDLVWLRAKRELQDRELAADYVQDFFARIWENRETFGAIEHFDAYLFVTARHLLFEYLRKIAREDHARREFLRGQPTEENSADMLVWEQEFQRRLTEKLDELPPRQKQIFILSREEGLSAREIAERLKIEEQTVYNQISLAWKTLRGIF